MPCSLHPLPLREDNVGLMRTLISSAGCTGFQPGQTVVPAAAGSSTSTLVITSQSCRLGHTKNLQCSLLAVEMGVSVGQREGGK